MMDQNKIKILYEGKYIRMVSCDTWEYAERVNCSGVVFIIAVTEDEKIVLCEQYRVPVQKHVIEIPAGLVNDGCLTQEETFEEAAKRELLEVTGYEAGKVVFMTNGPAAPGSSSALIRFYRAEGIKKVSSGGGDATENIKVHEVPLTGIEAWLQQKEREGKLVDPKIYAALYLIQSAYFVKE